MNKDLQKRYDEFQSQAVLNITRDFREKRSGRFLLVVPTGGGKTFTAVRAVCALFEQGTLSVGSDKVLWVAHRDELIEQSKATFLKWIDAHRLQLRLDEDINVESIADGVKTIASDSSVKLVVIDEAHHAAAPSYQPFFSRRDVGVLGLTATPSRHDGNPLDFERESYSIGFPDLVKRGIILRPTIHKIKGENIDINDLNNNVELNKLNTEGRNRKIIDELVANQAIYKKAVVYVGTKEHARALCQQMKTTELANLYESISYVVGDENSRGLDRKSFFEVERKTRRSIIVNVQVLTEGYDDPTINTVVMAAPSRSKLYYMQALGRALRHDPSDDTKIAYVLEVDDNLPNIRYRIDNRWLYSDISDAVEPAVIDAEYRCMDSLNVALTSLFDKYSVPPGDRTMPQYNERDRYSVLLFKQYHTADSYRHRAILINNENRTRVVNAFNYLSERAAHYVSHSHSAAAAFSALRNATNTEPFPGIDDRAVFDAITNAAMLTIPFRDNPAFVADGAPWITFCSFQLKIEEETLPDSLLNFIEGMVNAKEVKERVERNDFSDTDVLLRMPLPLALCFGLFVTSETATSLESIRADISKIKQTGGGDQLDALSAMRESTVFPLEMKYFNSMALIVRDELDYQYPMRRLSNV